MNFYYIAGNENNLRRREQKLIGEWRIVEKFQDQDRDFYRKTGFGEHLHKLLKNHTFLGGLFEELIRDRLKPQPVTAYNQARTDDATRSESRGTF